MSLEFPKVDLSGVNEAMENLNASLEKFAEDIQKRKDNAMAMEFTRVICNLLKENGVTVQMTEIEEENHATNKFEVKYGFAFNGLDFSEHDKKVSKEKDSQMELLGNINKAWIDTAERLSTEKIELSKKVEILEALIEEEKNKKSDVKQINLNDRVKVKLTPLGVEIYYHQYDELNKITKANGGTPLEPVMPQIDKDGYTEFTLHHFINLYGKHIGMAKPNVIQPLNIVIV